MVSGLGAALHGQARRLVEDQDLVVLPQHQAARESHVPRRNRLASLGRRRFGQGRDANLGASREPGVGLDPGAVDSKLAAARQLVDLGLAELGPATSQPAVEADPILAFPDRERLDLAHQAGASVLALQRAGT